VVVVPMSTVLQTTTEWLNTADIYFILADGVSSAPIRHAPRFALELGEIFFALKVYIVETANYQLLLGTSFMYKVGAALFPRLQRVLITIPFLRLSIHAVCEAITAGSSPRLQEKRRLMWTQNLCCRTIRS